VNLLVTMLLGGLWHGAAVHFVLWGAWHGLLLVAYGRRGRRAEEADGAPARPPRAAWAEWASRLLFFHLVAAGWLLFRAPDSGTLLAYLRGLAAGTTSLALPPLFLAVLSAAVLLHRVPAALAARAEALVVGRPSWLQAAAYAGAVLLLSALALDAQPFIYFRF
jgi:D-alanyl-lipoteichoic acid acyltransferase DltB (MBOAT superfamily)